MFHDSCGAICKYFGIDKVEESFTDRLDVRPTRLVTVGNRSFSTAGPTLWNSLLNDITSAPSLPVFRRKLKTYLFQRLYPDIVIAP